MNIGTEFEFTMKELADLVIELTDSKSKIVYSPLPQDDPKQRKPDLNLAKKLINWQPTISVRDGMQATIEYFKTIV
jgi:UDP-glucuronate decarboxylase